MTYYVRGDDLTGAARTCLTCGEPVILEYMPADPEPTGVLHLAADDDLYDHYATTDMTDIEDRLYGQPPAGWAE